MTLLEQAKREQNRKHDFVELTDEVVELVLAWLKDEVKDIAVRKVLAGNKNAATQSYPTIARALKKAYQDGKLTINEIPPTHTLD